MTTSNLHSLLKKKHAPPRWARVQASEESARMGRNPERAEAISGKSASRTCEFSGPQTAPRGRWWDIGNHGRHGRRWKRSDVEQARFNGPPPLTGPLRYGRRRKPDFLRAGGTKRPEILRFGGHPDLAIESEKRGPPLRSFPRRSIRAGYLYGRSCLPKNILRENCPWDRRRSR